MCRFKLDGIVLTLAGVTIMLVVPAFLRGQEGVVERGGQVEPSRAATDFVGQVESSRPATVVLWQQPSASERQRPTDRRPATLRSLCGTTAIRLYERAAHLPYR